MGVSDRSDRSPALVLSLFCRIFLFSFICGMRCRVAGCADATKRVLMMMMRTSRKFIFFPYSSYEEQR